jgi:hypothetical protein
LTIQRRSIPILVSGDFDALVECGTWFSESLLAYNPSSTPSDYIRVVNACNDTQVTTYDFYPFYLISTKAWQKQQVAQQAKQPYLASSQP